MSCTQCDLLKAQMREKIVLLHLQQNIPINELSKLYQVHRNTISNWKRVYLQFGLDGLINKSRAPHNHPNEFPSEVKEKIKTIRLDKNNRRILGPIPIKDQLFERYGINASRSGIANSLKKQGLIDTKKSKRNKKKNRFKKKKIQTPGELNQIDVKYAFKCYGDYWYYQYSSIDCFSRVAFGTIYEIQSNLESVLFLKSVDSFYPFKISGIQTDNHSTFTNRYTGYMKSNSPIPRLHAFDLTCQKLDIQHYLIDKGKPAQNTYVERFHRICEEEFYQRETFRNLEQARKKFRDFLHYYDFERKHQGIDGLTPIQKLQSVPEYSHIKYLNL